MRTTLDIPEELLEEARKTLGFQSKTDTVIQSLRELLRRRRIEELKRMLGHVRLDVDTARSRRRPKPRRRRG
jgi:Arc/MetJ family transcription regulator